MRLALLLAAALTAATVFAADAPELDEAMCLRGTVQETFDADVYTYARVATPKGETWVAVDHASVKVGTEIAIERGAVMHDFWSRTLQRSFEWIVFGRLAASCAAPGMPEAAVEAHRAAGVGSMSESAIAARRAAGVESMSDTAVAAHRAAGVTVANEASPAAAPAPAPIAKATGPDGRTVAEVVAQAASLDEKPVAVRGRVARLTSGVMGKNWLHLRDGSGTPTNGTDDVLVTTTGKTKVGEIVLVRGVVRTNRDFGSGYAYNVLIEDASLEP